VKEWAIVSRKPGVLVLSETAGAAAESAAREVLVCPFDIEGTAEALHQALTLPEELRHQWLDRFRQSVENWTARHWLEALLRELGLDPAKNPSAASAPVRRQTKTIERIETTLTVQNKLGIHARPAAAFVRCAREFTCELEIEKEDEIYSAKSILAVLSAGLDEGTTFLLRARGSDAHAAVERIRKLLAEFTD
jgi:phosphocarrier protein